MKTLFLAIRLKTLSASVTPILVVTTLLLAEGRPILWWVSGLALLGALFIQMATNLINDAIDFEKGADTSERIGPQRVTVSGAMTQRQVYFYAGVMMLAAILCGWPLVREGGLVILVIGVVSLFLAYGYTGGPFPLAYLGLGDVFVILFFGLIAVGATHYLHTKELFLPDAIVAGLQIGFLSTVLIALNNFRDMDQDRLVNKKTWAVRFGSKFVRFEIVFLFLATFLLNVYWFFNGWFWAGLLPLVLVYPCLQLLRRVFQEPPSPLYNSFLAQSAKLQIIFAILLSLGFVLEAVV